MPTPGQQSRGQAHATCPLLPSHWRHLLPPLVAELPLPLPLTGRCFSLLQVLSFLSAFRGLRGQCPPCPWPPLPPVHQGHRVTRSANVHAGPSLGSVRPGQGLGHAGKTRLSPWQAHHPATGMAGGTPGARDGGEEVLWGQCTASSDSSFPFRYWVSPPGHTPRMSNATCLKRN